MTHMCAISDRHERPVACEEGRGGSGGSCKKLFRTMTAALGLLGTSRGIGRRERVVMLLMAQLRTWGATDLRFMFDRAVLVTSNKRIRTCASSTRQ
jgi:hypothetical protein